jgi:hypothetical protein
MSDNDSELIDAEFDRVEAKYGHEAPASSLPERDRTIACVVTSKGILDNGGFSYLFETVFCADPTFEWTRQSYDLIGAKFSAEAFTWAWASFPQKGLPSSVDERLMIWVSVPSEIRRSIDHLYWKDDVWKLLADYIRATG